MYIFLTTTGSIQNSSAGTMTRLHMTERPEFDSWQWKDSTVSRLALGHTIPNPRGSRNRIMQLITHFN